MSWKGLHAIWLLPESYVFKSLACEELLRRFLSEHNDQTFRELMRRHGKGVYLQCRAILPCEDMVHEAFQATFIALALKGHTIKYQRSVGAWLIRTARHKAINIKRGLKIRQNIEQSLEAELAETVQGKPVVSLSQQAEVFAALTELPEKYRTALTLCVIHGATHAEAAKELRWPHGTVDTRVRKGLELLKKKLERRGWSAAGATLPTILATKAEAVPPSLSKAVFETAMQAIPVHTGWKLLASGVWGILLGYWTWVSAGIVVLGIGLGGFAYSHRPVLDAKTLAESPVKNVNLLRAEIHQKNLLLFRSQVVPQVQAALQKIKLWNQPVKVIDVREHPTFLICTMEQQIKLGKPLLTTRTVWNYNVLTGVVHVDIDKEGNGQWKSFDVDAPIWYDNPLNGKRVNITLPELKEAEKAFQVLTPEPFEYEPEFVKVRPDLQTLRPYLGLWHNDNETRDPLHLMIAEDGRAYLHNTDGRVYAVRRSADSTCWEIQDWGKLSLSEDAQRIRTSLGSQWKR